MRRSALCASHANWARFSRREILRAGGLSLLGLNLPELLRGRAWAQQAAADVRPAAGSFGKAKRCIFMFMWGGPAHQDTWDLKPAAPAEVRGEFSPISTCVPGIQICEHLPELAKRADRLAIVRSLTHNNVDHTRATHFLLTGQPPPPGDDFSKDWPSIGAVLARLGRGSWPLPPFVSMRPKLENDVPRFVEESHGQFGGLLGPAYHPLTIDENPAGTSYKIGEFSLPPELTDDRFGNRRQLLAQISK